MGGTGYNVSIAFDSDSPVRKPQENNEITHCHPGLNFLFLAVFRHVCARRTASPRRAKVVTLSLRALF